MDKNFSYRIFNRLTERFFTFFTECRFMAFLADLGLVGVLLACPVACGVPFVLSWFLGRRRHGQHESNGHFDPSCPLCAIPKQVAETVKAKRETAR